MLTGAVAFQSFKVVAGRRPQVCQGGREVDDDELATGRFDQVGGEALGRLAREDCRSSLVAEALDHIGMLHVATFYVNSCC